MTHLRRLLLALAALALAGLAGCGPTPQQYNSQGVWYMQLKDYNKALGAFQEAAERDPDNATYQYNVGAAYQAIGQLDQAILHYNAAIRLQPGLADAYKNLAVCYQFQGREDLAIDALERGCQANSLSAAPFYNYGLHLLEKGDKAKAEHYLRKAVVADPNDPDAHYILAEFLIREGRREEGTAEYHRSLELRPLNPQGVESVREAIPPEPPPAPQKPETVQ